MQSTQVSRNRTLALGVLVIAMVALFWTLPDLDADLVKRLVHDIGPLAIVYLVALGIVISPIPSGAVALVAGALYGTLMGGALTIAGAVIGAATAFALSRHFGRHPVMASQTGLARLVTRDRSQNKLTALVFATRLIPFISFDAVSYLAGLTPIRFHRFVLATAAGTTPVCLAFAAAGASASEGEANPWLLSALCGITLLLPVCLWALKSSGRTGTLRNLSGGC